MPLIPVQQAPVIKDKSAAHGNLDIPFVESSLAGKSFMVRAPTVWNQIPPGIRNSRKIETFKKDLKKWVKANIEIS